MNTQTQQLNAQHYKECVEKRGLDPQWISANCQTVTANEATQYLGYTAQSDGIWLKGCNHQSQFKPDRPWKAEDDKKAPKYRSPRGEYDAILATHPTDPHYWSVEALKQKCWQIDGHPCLLVTEGFFKSIAGCSNGIPTIALLGVEMGLSSSGADLQGRRYLVSTLERYAKAGFGFVVVFDADCATNKNVVEAQRKLAHQLKLFKVPVFSVTGLWAVEQGKGMDDYIQNHGSDRFKKEVMGKAVDIEAWEKQLQQEKPAKDESIPPADLVGREIVEDYRDRLLWNDEHKTWKEYSLERDGVWSPVSETYLESAIDTILESKGIFGYGSACYVSNVLAKMRRQLFARVWGERSINEILPFSDGVLELATGQFHKHAPGHRLTWSLPRPYNAIATGWTKIKSWLSQATGGNAQHEEILLCFAAAVLRGRCDLHKFLHLIGVGGTGKSTFTRLLETLIGSQNCWNGSLQDLEDKHSVADLLGKRLAILPDQDRVSSGLSNFKRLTGQDSLRGRRLYKDGLNFRFPGMAIVTSNNPIFHADGGSWLTRRIIMLSFDFKPAVDKIRNLEAEFEPELSAFTNHLLSISNEEITRVLRGIGKDGVSSTLWQAKIRTDSICAWVNDRVIHDPVSKSQIGGDRDEWARDVYNPNSSTLFGSYSHYCRTTGLQAKGKNNFSADLIELCQQTLDWTDVQYDRDNQGRRVIRGLRLRVDGDTAPTLDDFLTTDNLSDNLSDNPSDNLKPSAGKESDNPDNLLPLKLLENRSEFTSTQKDLPPYQVPIASIQPESCQSLEKVLEEKVVSNTQTPTQPAIQVVSEVVSEVVSGLSEAIAPTESQQLASALLLCKTWVEVESIRATKPDAVFASAVRCLSLEQRQHLVELLADNMCYAPHGAYDPFVNPRLPAFCRKLEEKAFELYKVFVHEIEEVWRGQDLDFEPTEELCAVPGEMVAVWFPDRWVKALLLQKPNNDPDPLQSFSGWRVSLVSSGEDAYFWDAREIRDLKVDPITPADDSVSYSDDLGDFLAELIKHPSEDPEDEDDDHLSEGLDDEDSDEADLEDDDFGF